MGQSPRRSERPYLRLVPPLEATSDDATGHRTSHGGPGGPLTEEVAALLAGTTDEALSSAPLALPLALSVCMERHGVDAGGLVDAMCLLRRGLLAVAGPRAHDAPVPLVTGDPRTAALGLANHLHDLFDRAAGATGDDRRAVATSALESLAVS